jgi:hypothetical protein
VFEPVYQPGRNTEDGTREESIDALSPKNAWWSSQSIAGNTNGASVPMPSFQELCQQNPNMKITAVLFESGQTGGGAPFNGFHAAGDNLVIGLATASPATTLRRVASTRGRAGRGWYRARLRRAWRVSGFASGPGGNLPL